MFGADCESSTIPVPHITTGYVKLQHWLVNPLKSSGNIRWRWTRCDTSDSTYSIRVGLNELREAVGAQKIIRARGPYKKGNWIRKSYAKGQLHHSFHTPLKNRRIERRTSERYQKISGDLYFLFI